MWCTGWTPDGAHLLLCEDTYLVPVDTTTWERDGALVDIAAQSIDIRFEDFMADEEGTLRAIYERAGQPFDDGVRAAMRDFLRANPRGRYGEVDYDPTVLGLDVDAAAERFRAYRDRFVP